jgi:hypothetical protein
MNEVEGGPTPEEKNELSIEPRRLFTEAEALGILEQAYNQMVKKPFHSQEVAERMKQDEQKAQEWFEQYVDLGKMQETCKKTEEIFKQYGIEISRSEINHFFGSIQPVSKDYLAALLIAEEGSNYVGATLEVKGATGMIVGMNGYVLPGAEEFNEAVFAHEAIHLLHASWTAKMEESDEGFGSKKQGIQFIAEGLVDLLTEEVTGIQATTKHHKEKREEVEIIADWVGKDLLIRALFDPEAFKSFRQQLEQKKGKGAWNTLGEIDYQRGRLLHGENYLK